MFGFAALGVYAFGEFPPFRSGFALTAQLFVLPAVRGTLNIGPAHGASVSLRPR